MAGLWPPSWCPWSSWELCTVEPCTSGVRLPLLKTQRDPTLRSKEALKEYCVNSTNYPITALHWPVDARAGTYRLVTPTQQRRRRCRCHTLKSLIDRFFQKTCKENEVQVDCHTCFPPFSGIYSRSHKGEPLLSCNDLAESRSAAAAASASSSNFYAILGGALGTAAFLVIVFCCVRFFFFSSGVRRRVRRPGGGSRGGGMVGGGLGDSTADPALRRPVNTLPYPHLVCRLCMSGFYPAAEGRRYREFTIIEYFHTVTVYSLNSELPPAYKDVVAMTVILPTATEQCDGSPNQRLLTSLSPPSPPPALPPSSTPPLSVAEESSEGLGGSNESGGSEDPPPPSYQDVISFSPSAADMRQQVLAAAAEAATVREQSTI
ncbi:unnamed protein product [Hydatigera taeniaeformis]|uniref:Protein shisa-9 n=1 Tax=Hydatigena taeniaeformis TaxID=6205 RepID=A0A0R3X524_HYDTA|nr:unnamed protein product [Hydatigera taeniaeformis]